jgi:Domain of unknown function (DUF4136)
MTRLSVFVMVMLAVCAAPAYSQDVRYDFDKEKDFSKYKTYKWVEIKGADKPDDLTSKKIVAAIDAELSKKGMSKTEAGSADLYVGYQTAITTEKQYTMYNTGWDYGPGWGAGWYGYGGMTGPSFCTTANERVYITARGCETVPGGGYGLPAAGAGGR